MPRAQPGVTPHPPKNALFLSFKVEDLPLKAMSIGHIAANIPGLVNELRESASASDLLYSIGFGTLLWNFIWQGQHPPGFRPLEFDNDEEDEEAEEPDLVFCFFSSNPDLLQYLAKESQTHLKNIAKIDEMVLAKRVQGPKFDNPVENEKTNASVLIDKKYPEFSQSSFLFTLGLTDKHPANSLLSPEEQEAQSLNLAKDFASFIGEETGLIHHLYSWQTENERGHYFLSMGKQTDPFQKILDTTLSPSNAFQTGNIEMTPALYFLPSLEILAAFRMGTLRMGPLSPTAKWK